MSTHSRTSLEGEFNDSEEYETYEEYLKMLKNNNHIIGQALRKAEDLIQEYQRENQELRDKNNRLESKLSDLQDEVEYLKHLLLKDQGSKMQARIVDLTLRNENAEKRMGSLLQELDKSQAKVAKLTRLKQQKAQKSMQNYFEFATPKSKGLQTPAHDDLNKQIRSLKWKLEQRQEQIVYMIKKNKLLQQKQQERKHKDSHRNFKKLVDEDRFHTCQTEPNRVHNF